ncbi:hypothetical protein HU200_016085 [Digitaria exilis]|uniref:RRM domain-containing protein n=1 Tax=Digitaria exilis TaxID=1010633 RepID=A0A835F9J2_9POAL|nr:hypothetical protein HU200_016085 [Digitaria exilis]
MQPSATTSMAPPPASPCSRAPPFRPLELPLPSALLPPKKRRVSHPPPKATIPIPPPPPPPVPAAAGGPRPEPEKPSFPPPPTTEKPSSSRPPPPTQDNNPSSPPPSASETPSSPQPPPPPRFPTDAAAGNRAPTRKVRKVIPKGTIATRKAAAVGAASAAAGLLQPGEGHGPDEPPTDRHAAGDEMVVEEQNLGGNAVKEPTAGCNAVPVCEALLGKEIVGDCVDAPEVEKLAKRGEITKVRMSEGQRRRMTEVFVGGLNRDATEEDVKAVLAEAGEITEVRMVMDAGTKNRGYCFVRYREAAQARKAVAEFGNVKIRGKLCGVEAVCRNDKIFLGNINKKWQREDVKTVFVEGVPNSWDQAKMKEIFKKYGKIELVLSRDLRMTKRNDVAFITYTTREAAILCLESSDGEQLIENGSKVNIKVALAKSATKGKKNMDKKCCISEKETTKIPKSELIPFPSTF